MASARSLQKSIPSLGRFWYHFSPYIRNQWVWLVSCAIALLADVMLRLLEPWPLKFVFDHVLINSSDDTITAIPFINTLDPLTLLTLSAFGVVAITGLRALASYWSTVGLALVSSRVLMEVRDRLYRHLQSLSLTYYSKARSGDLLVRISTDTSRLQEIILTAILPLLLSILTLFGMVGVMFWLDRDLTLLALITFPFFGLAATRLSDRIKDSSRKQRQREGAVAATLAESIGAIKLVQALSLQDAFAGIFSNQNKKSLKESVKTQKLAANLERTVDVVIAIGTAILLWYGARLVLRDALTPGDVLVFLTYLKNAFKPVQNFAKYTGRLSKAAASAERVIDILEEKPEVYNSPDAIHAPPFKGAVRFDRVSFAYEPGQDLLKEINLEVQPGQQVALVGPSGSGKSTLVSLLLRLYEPITGRVIIDDRDIREYTIESLRPQISVVLQDSILFAATVWENIAYGVANATREDIEKAVRLANAHEFVEALPQGYDTILGERGSTLSGGQRQRLAIARAAIRKTPILILDEPTTGLDKKNEQEVIEALERVAQNRTTFIITHDLNIATRADLILYMEHGEVLEQGTHSELMQLQGRYAALYQMQSAVRVTDDEVEQMRGSP
ncbi:ABC transporter transmembrane domain-containing protein [Lyngbya aestuarii]|uniref:ABC transporter transmembrane domain-containing protein n=1 Tax=Lyngbya aestuarii TaxID=118322 RepID=UPI00403E2A18